MSKQTRFVRCSHCKAFNQIVFDANDPEDDTVDASSAGAVPGSPMRKGGGVKTKPAEPLPDVMKKGGAVKRVPKVSASMNVVDATDAVMLAEPWRSIESAQDRASELLLLARAALGVV
jgi:hypothetical protein